jgi:transposase
MNDSTEDESTDESTSTKATENQIIHRWRGGQSMRGIAKALGIGRWRVRRVIREHADARDADSNVPVNPELPPPVILRSSKLDAFQTQIDGLLKRYPHMTATRVFEELKQQGYEGGYTIVRQRVKQLRRAPAKPLTVRFETAAGVQAQMDWAVYDIDFTQEGRRRVNLFSYVLGYSRRQFICFSERQDHDATVRGHIRAFEHLQGLAATCLYDNMTAIPGMALIE